MQALPEPETAGSLLRHVMELLDGDVARVYREAGVPDYRPRFSPVVRALVAHGPMSIRDLAWSTGVTHSAASQTVAQMHRSGLVRHEPGTDARQRIVHLTTRTQALLPLIEAEWAATARAARDLDAELSIPLAELLRQVVAALHRRPFGERIAATMTDAGSPARSGDPGGGRLERSRERPGQPA